MNSNLTDAELTRYSRHLLLPEIDFEGQTRLRAARIAIIGAGGLGCPAALYLASSGIGQITLVDDDHIDTGNLQRQIAYQTAQTGQPKASTLATTLRALNPEIDSQALTQRLNDKELNELCRNNDLILDCSDNFDTRFAINLACVAQDTPLVSGAAIRFHGQVSCYHPKHDNSPCYACLYREAADDTEQSCADRGIFAPLTGIVGSIQAAEAIKLITGCGEPLVGRLLQIDALSMNIRSSRLKRDPHCPVCGPH